MESTSKWLSGSAPSLRLPMPFGQTLAMAFFAGCLLGATTTAAATQEPVYDVSSVVEQSYSLSGEWGIAPNVFLAPASWSELNAALQGSVEVPGDWTGQVLPSGEVLEAQGSGTLVARVWLRGTQRAGLILNSTNKAFRIFALDSHGGVLAEMSLGTPGQSLELSHPANWYTDVTSFKNETGDEPITVVIHYSNFHHSRGGLEIAPRIAELSVAKREVQQVKAGTAAIFGIFLIIGVYHLILSFQRLEGASTLYFSALVLSLALREFVMSGYLDEAGQFSALRYQFLISIEYLTMSFFMVSGALFFGSMVKNFWYERFVKCFTLPVGLGLAALTLLVDTVTFTGLLPLYQLYIVVGLVSVLVHFRQGARRGNELARWMEWGFVVVMLGVSNDIFMALGLLSTGYWGSAMVVSFVLLQGVLISRRFAFLDSQDRGLRERLLQRQTELADSALKAAEAEKHAAGEALTKVKLFQEAAHHFNNPLNHILGASELLGAQIEELKAFLDSLVDPEHATPDEIKVFEQEVERLTVPCDGSLVTIERAVARASLMVGLLRRLSGIDGVLTKETTLAEILDFVREHSDHQPLPSRELFADNGFSQRIAADPFVVGKALIWLLDVIGPEAVQTPSGLSFDAETGLLAISGGWVNIPDERLRETQSLITTLLRPYGATIRIDSAEVQIKLPLTYSQSSHRDSLLS